MPISNLTNENHFTSLTFLRIRRFTLFFGVILFLPRYANKNYFLGKILGPISSQFFHQIYNELNLKVYFFKLT